MSDSPHDESAGNVYPDVNDCCDNCGNFYYKGPIVYNGDTCGCCGGFISTAEYVYYGGHCAECGEQIMRSYH